MHQSTIEQTCKQVRTMPNVKSVSVGYMSASNKTQIITLKVQLFDSSRQSELPAIINNIPVDIVD